MIIVRGVWNHHSYTVGHATTKSWNSSIVHILQLCIVFTVSVVFLHWLYIYELMSSTTFTYGYFFKLVFLLSECDRTLPPLCYTQPNLFTNSSCAFYLKLVQNLHCVLVSWRICERNIIFISNFSAFVAQILPHPMTGLIYSTMI